MRSMILAIWLVALATLSGSAQAESLKLVSLRGHDAHGRYFDLATLRGQVVAVTFASRFTREEADRVNNALLRHAAEGDMMVINILDFGGIPSLFHGYAKRKAGEHDQPGRIYHLADERGELKRQFQVEPSKRVDILVIDRAGNLRGRFAGSGQLEDAARLVDQLRTSSASR